MAVDRLTELQHLIAADRRRMHVLALVRDLGLPDCWVGAGFVRQCVWDHLHSCTSSPMPQDIDVIWFDAQRCLAETDAALEQALRAQDDTLGWSVKNQARMHRRNADSPYGSASDAMRYWPETATAVGVRLGPQGAIEVSAPHGLADLFDLVVRPTPRFAADKHTIYRERIRSKDWKGKWPRLRIEGA